MTAQLHVVLDLYQARSKSETALMFIVGRPAAIDRRPLVLWLGSAILSELLLSFIEVGHCFRPVLGNVIVSEGVL